MPSLTSITDDGVQGSSKANGAVVEAKKSSTAKSTPTKATSHSQGNTANGSGVKRKSRASTSEPDNGNQARMKANGRAAADADPTARDNKRVRRGGTPGAGGSRLAKKETASYTVKTGINALPKPVPAITRAVLDAGLAADTTAAISSDPAPGVSALLGKGETLAREMFVFGNGDMGQHGLGTEALDEIKRPRRHAWVAKANDDGKLGKGGLEMVAAGGMHSLAIDSTGRVSGRMARSVYILSHPAAPPQILSWGINDNAALGRRTTRDAEIEAEVYETEPMPVEGLSPSGVGILGGPAPTGGKEGQVEKFRATRVAAGDSVSVALSDQGEVRVWGSFRVS